MVIGVEPKGKKRLPALCQTSGRYDRLSCLSFFTKNLQVASLKCSIYNRMDLLGWILSWILNLFELRICSIRVESRKLIEKKNLLNRTKNLLTKTKWSVRRNSHPMIGFNLLPIYIELIQSKENGFHKVVLMLEIYSIFMLFRR